MYADIHKDTEVRRIHHQRQTRIQVCDPQQVRKTMRKQNAPLRDRLLEPAEAAALLGIRKSTVYQWAYQRKLPTVKLFNKSLRFRESVLLGLIAQFERPALGAHKLDLLRR